MDLVPTFTVSEAHPETMDFLSSAWCNFAVQTVQQGIPPQPDGSLALVTDPTLMRTEKINVNSITSPSSDFQIIKGPSLDEEADMKSLPPWKSSDLKSWLWMQQALHPEVNYTACFQKKHWRPWRNSNPFKSSLEPIKKWLHETKQKRKEEGRLKRAEVHGAISIAGVAAALASIAAQDSNSKKIDDSGSKESAVASAAALVASQCAAMARTMGASSEQLNAAIGYAMAATDTSDILTLTAAAATSIKGADALKARKKCMMNRLYGKPPVLSIRENNDDEDGDDYDFEHGRSCLSRGAELNVETSEGKVIERMVSIILNSKAEVQVKLKRPTSVLNPFPTKKESLVLELHAELYCDPEDSYTTCYLIVLTTNRGTIKLDMSNDYPRYKIWIKTIKRMLIMSMSLTRFP